MRIIYGVCRNELYVQLYTQIMTKIFKLNVHQCMYSNHYALTTIITYFASLGHYNCRVENCDKVYVYQSALADCQVHINKNDFLCNSSTLIHTYITVYIICNRQEGLKDLNLSLFLHSHEINVHHKTNERRGQLRNEYGYFYYRADCGHIFSTKATRNMYLPNKHCYFCQLVTCATKPNIFKLDPITTSMDVYCHCCKQSWSIP